MSIERLPRAKKSLPQPGIGLSDVYNDILNLNFVDSPETYKILLN